MGAIETLKLIVSADTAAAGAAFQKLGGEAEANLTKAEAGTSKMSGAMSALSANAVPIVAGLAAAAIGLGMSWEKTAVAVGNFSTVSGLTTEQASRLRVVAEALGVSTDTLGRGIGIMLKTAGNAPKEFAKFGAEIVRTKDGAVDANATFNKLIDRLKAIKDPAEQNAAGAKLLGKAWKEMAPLIDAGSASLQQLEAAVPKGEIIHPEDVAQARDMKQAFAELEDAAKGLGMEVGKQLAPTLTEAARGGEFLVQGLGHVFDALNKVNVVTKTWAEELTHTTEYTGMMGAALADTTAANYELNKSIDRGSDVWTVHAGKLLEVATTEELVKQATKDAAEAHKVYEESVKASDAALKSFAAAEKAAATELKTEHDAARAAADSHYALKIATDKAQVAQQTYNDEMKAAKGNLEKQDIAGQNLKDTFAAVGDVMRKTYEETATSNGVTLTAAQSFDTWSSAILNSSKTLDGPQKQAIADYVASIGQVPPEKLTEFKADVASGDLAGAQKILDDAAAAREAQIRPTVDQGSLDAIDGAIQNQLNQHQFTVPVSGQLVGSPGAPGYAPVKGRAFAAGGHYEAGVPRITGEHGIEFDIPDHSGTIIPGGGRGGGGFAGGGDTHFHLDMSGMTVNAGMGANGFQFGQQAMIAINDGLLKLWREQGPNKK